MTRINKERLKIKHMLFINKERQNQPLCSMMAHLRQLRPRVKRTFPSLSPRMTFQLHNMTSF